MAQTSEQQAPTTTGISDAVVEWRRETLERAGLDNERAERETSKRRLEALGKGKK